MHTISISKASATTFGDNTLRSTPLVIARFATATPPKGKPALGTIVSTDWQSLGAELVHSRREGPKNGPNLVFARFNAEPDGSAHRVKDKVAARTAIVLDCECDKTTGEIPPSFQTIIRTIGENGFAAAVYTSHNHMPQAPRYRIVLPLTSEIDHHFPVVEVMAAALGLSGVLDRSKLGAASLFYLPSCERGQLANHHAALIEGDPVSAAWVTSQAAELLKKREAEQSAQRAEALKKAEIWRANCLKAGACRGLKPGDNLIERIRNHLDLASELERHGYVRRGDRFLFPGSQTGIPGVHIMTGNDGVERVFSHHAADPLAYGNLPEWCSVKAIDVVDVLAVLDFNGDLKKALHILAKRFGIDDKPSAGNNKPASQMPPGSEPAADGEPHPKAEKAYTSTGMIWPEPVDFLGGEASGAPVLRAKHIPAALWPFVTDTAARMGVEPVSIAMCGLVSCATVITDAWIIQPKFYDYTWVESARLWVAIVGDPSILKTPVISLTTSPIDKMEAEARKKHQEAKQKWRIEEAKAKKNKTVPPPKPKCERYLVENTTVEALGEVLRNDDDAESTAPSGKVLCRQDELSEFFGNLDKYTPGGRGSGDRGAYLRIYNGGRYTIDRIGRGSFVVPNWSACFLGGIQPGPIKRIARDSAEDGLLTRPMYCVPDRQSPSLDRTPDRVALKRYDALFPALAELQPATAIGTGCIMPVRLHADAQRHRKAIDELARALSAVPDTSLRLKATFGKWPGLFARLCLTFHLIDIADLRARGEEAPDLYVISDRTAEKVADFMREIVLPHLMRAEAIMFTTDQSGHARWVSGFILSKRLDRITTRDVMMNYRQLRAPEARRELDAVMASLVAVGWLEPEVSSNPAKPVTSWQVNPAVHVAFAKRAETEAARRSDEREKIAKAIAEVRMERNQEAA